MEWGERVPCEVGGRGCLVEWGMRVPCGVGGAGALWSGGRGCLAKKKKKKCASLFLPRDVPPPLLQAPWRKRLQFFLAIPLQVFS